MPVPWHLDIYIYPLPLSRINASVIQLSLLEMSDQTHQFCTCESDPRYCGCPVHILVRFLDELVSRKKSPVRTKSKKVREFRSVFHLDHVPDVSLIEYIKRLHERFQPPFSIYVCCIVLINRLLRYDRTLVLDERSVHLILLSM